MVTSVHITCAIIRNVPLLKTKPWLFRRRSADAQRQSTDPNSHTFASGSSAGASENSPLQTTNAGSTKLHNELRSQRCAGAGLIAQRKRPWRCREPDAQTGLKRPCAMRYNVLSY